MNNKPLLECKNLSKSYVQGNNKLIILNNVNFQISVGQTVSIVGSSGSGKSTLLHLLASLDEPDTGDIIFNNIAVNKLSKKNLCLTRNKYFGFIYQFHHLLPEFTAIENVLMPLTIRGNVVKHEINRAYELLSYLKLNNRANHYPGQLSGGERQRVAIVRALINNPLIVFADEPTGNLDNAASNIVMEIFFRLQKEINTSLIIVTHDLQIANTTNIRYLLRDGILYNSCS